jgi:hypothetical protein
MQRGNQGVLLSASDLMRFAGCAHATTLDLALARGEGPGTRGGQRGRRPPPAARRRARGAPSGAAPGRGPDRRDRAGRRDAREAAATARRAGQQGAEVVFQGASRRRGWGGWSDFLERVERPSALGPWSYEVTDTKLKRSRTPSTSSSSSSIPTCLPRSRARRPSAPMSSSATAAARRSASPTSRPMPGGCGRGSRPSLRTRRRPGPSPARIARSAAGARSARRGWTR